MNFALSFQSEWQKKKRSLSAWLVIVGAFFTPAILFVYKLIRYKNLPRQNVIPDFWEDLWKASWESMAIFLLPIGVILATSLITQLEYKNNTWKQLHTTPQKYPTIFFAKLSVISVMILQCLVLFAVAVYLCGVVPGLLTGAPYPTEPVPVKYFAVQTAEYFIDCLPIIALQYLISLQFKNFIAPIGIGIALWILSIAVLQWEYGYIIPYTYPSYHYLTSSGRMNPGFNYHALALGYFVVFTVASYILYVNKKEKG
jgi:lantibiotic transport system permease protein